MMTITKTAPVGTSPIVHKLDYMGRVREVSFGLTDTYQHYYYPGERPLLSRLGVDWASGSHSDDYILYDRDAPLLELRNGQTVDVAYTTMGEVVEWRDAQAVATLVDPADYLFWFGRASIHKQIDGLALGVPDWGFPSSLSILDPLRREVLGLEATARSRQFPATSIRPTKTLPALRDFRVVDGDAPSRYLENAFSNLFAVSPESLNTALRSLESASVSDSTDTVIEPWTLGGCELTQGLFKYTPPLLPGGSGYDHCYDHDTECPPECLYCECYGDCRGAGMCFIGIGGGSGGGGGGGGTGEPICPGCQATCAVDGLTRYVGEYSHFSAIQGTPPCDENSFGWSVAGASSYPPTGSASTFDTCWTGAGAAIVGFGAHRSCNSVVVHTERLCPPVVVQPCRADIANWDSDLCGGDTFTFTAIGQPFGRPYFWFVDGLPAAGNGPVFQHVFNTAGLHTVGVDYGAGCGSGDCEGHSVGVNVLQPAQNVMPPSDTTVIQGGTAFFSVGGSGISCTWSENGVPINPIVNPTAATCQLQVGNVGLSQDNHVFTAQVTQNCNPAPLALTATLRVISLAVTAFRPTTEGPAYGAPFDRRAVPDGLEELPGAGIRINGDTEIPNNENDLIEVELSATVPAPTGTQYFLRRSNTNIRVWNSQTMGSALLQVGTEALITISSSPMSVWVECLSGSAADLDLVARSGGTTLGFDRIHFYPFTSIVIALGGLNQVPADPSGDGIFQLAIDLFDQGYDVHMYDEDNLDDEGAGAPYDEVVRAIQHRNVNTVAVYGFSYGGGSTHDLAERLVNNQATIGAFTIPFTAYVDAIAKGGVSSETRRPPASLFHVNVFQEGTIADGFLDGAPTDPPGADFEWNVDDPTPTESHVTIDDEPSVLNAIETRLVPRVNR